LYVYIREHLLLTELSSTFIRILPFAWLVDDPWNSKGILLVTEVNDLRSRSHQPRSQLN